MEERGMSCPLICRVRAVNRGIPEGLGGHPCAMAQQTAPCLVMTTGSIPATSTSGASRDAGECLSNINGRKNMKRTKEWWAMLTKSERSELTWLEKAEHHSHGSAYIPDDCRECGNCGTPTLYSGLCPLCSKRLGELLTKASGKQS